MKSDKAKKSSMVFIFLTAALLFLAPALKAAMAGEHADQTAKNVKQEVVKLHYVEATSIRSLLSPYFGPETRISVDPKSKVLVISDTAENLERILGALKKIDVKPKTINNELK